MPIIGGIDLTAGTIGTVPSATPLPHPRPRLTSDEHSKAAFGTLLVYDVFFVTYDQEVKLIWPSRWNLGKVLFFLNRYLPFFDTFLSLHLLIGKTTDHGCLLGFSAVTWLIVVGIIIAEIILMIRTYAIWERKRAILITLVVLGLSTFIPGIIITQLEVMSFAYRAGRNGRGCVKTEASSPIIFIAFLLLIMCETIIVILTLVRARHHYLARQTRSPLIWQLYKDGLLYYIYLLGFSIVNVITAVAAPPDYTNWLTTPQRVVHSLLCSRVLLHIRSHNTTPDTEIITTQIDMSFTPYDDLGHAMPSHSVGTTSASGSGSRSGSGSGSGSGQGTSSRSDSEADTRLFLTFSSHTDSLMSPSEARSSVFRYKDVESPDVDVESPNPRGQEEIELQPLSRSRSRPQIRFHGVHEVPRTRGPGKGKDRDGG